MFFLELCELNFIVGHIVLVVSSPEGVLANPSAQHQQTTHKCCDSEVSERVSDFLLCVGQTSGLRHTHCDVERVVEKTWLADATACVLLLEERKDLNRCVDLEASRNALIVRVIRCLGMLIHVLLEVLVTPCED